VIKRSVQVLWGLLAIVFVAGAAPAWAQTNSYTFTKINVPGSVYTEATGVNNSGQVVGTYQDAGGFTHGFSYNGTSFTTIDYPATGYNYVFGVNAAGQMVGGYSVSNPLGPYHGFIYHNGVFTEFDYPLRETDGRGINNLGQIVGIYNQGFGTPDHGFYKDGDNYASLDYPGASKTYTFGINDLGVVTGTWVDALNRLRGYWHFGGIYTLLNYPGASQTYIGGINNSNTMAGWSQQGTLKTSFVLKSLASFRSFTVPFPGATATLARAINDSNQVVGSYQSPDCPRGCGFIATPNPTALPACTQSVALGYSGNTLTFNFTIGTAAPTTWSTYLFVNNIPYTLWSSPLPVVNPALPATFQLPLPPVGRVVALTTLSTAVGGILCADYAVLNTSPGGTP
jgi:probable HAF family extracellular repeat protein